MASNVEAMASTLVASTGIHLVHVWHTATYTILEQELVMEASGKGKKIVAMASNLRKAEIFIGRPVVKERC